MAIRREKDSPPTRNPIDMAPGLGYRISSDRQPGIEQANMRRMPQYRSLPIPPGYERGPYEPLPIPPGYERGPYKPMPSPPDYERGPMPTPPNFMPQPPFTPEEFDDYFKNRRTGFNTSETARENFISRTDGGYPNRQDPSFMDRYGDYIKRGLEYMPTPFPGINLGAGTKILRGLGSLYGGNAAEYIDELPATPLDPFYEKIIEDLKREDDQTSGIMGAMPQERQMAGLTQTWQKIFENVGEDAANKWLASQQAAVPMAT